MLEVDPARLAQVLSNLLNNAAKYTPEGGQIELTAALTGSDVVINVKDNGIGIAPELLPKLFDLFVQADQTLSRSRGGLGIGLTVVRSLVEMHEGTVSAHSEGPGKGSEFTIRIPLAESSAVAVGKAEAPPDGPDRDLAPPAHSRGRRQSPKRGQPRETAHRSRARRSILPIDGRQALEMARIHHPDVILLDIGLPVMDGYEVARLLPPRSCLIQDRPGRHDRLRQGRRQAALTARGFQRTPRQAGRSRRPCTPPRAHRDARPVLIDPATLNSLESWSPRVSARPGPRLADARAAWRGPAHPRMARKMTQVAQPRTTLLRAKRAKNAVAQPPATLRALTAIRTRLAVHRFSSKARSQTQGYLHILRYPNLFSSRNNLQIPATYSVMHLSCRHSEPPDPTECPTNYQPPSHMTRRMRACMMP